MEKLLKLLNEYVGEEYLYTEFELQDGTRDNFFHNKEGEHEIEESYVISKKFGFIKWLVENDKIDRGKIEEGISGDVSLYLDNREYYGRYKWLLMLLAISDSSINDLCEMLV